MNYFISVARWCVTNCFCHHMVLWFLTFGVLATAGKPMRQPLASKHPSAIASCRVKISQAVERLVHILHCNLQDLFYGTSRLGEATCAGYLHARACIPAKQMDRSVPHAEWEDSAVHFLCCGYNKYSQKTWTVLQPEVRWKLGVRLLCHKYFKFGHTRSLPDLMSRPATVALFVNSVRLPSQKLFQYPFNGFSPSRAEILSKLQKSNRQSSASITDSPLANWSRNASTLQIYSIWRPGTPRARKNVLISFTTFCRKQPTKEAEVTKNNSHWICNNYTMEEIIWTMLIKQENTIKPFSQGYLTKA